MAVLTHFLWLTFVFSIVIAGELQTGELQTEKPKTAAVFGGGPAGLTAAMELRQAGFDVKVYDKEDHFGGKMKGHVDKDGYPNEHSFRLYGLKYYALGDVLSRAGLDIPTEYETDSSLFKQLTLYIGSSTGYYSTRDSNDPNGLVRKMLELGFMPAEFQYMGFQVAAWRQMSADAINALYDVAFTDFIDSGFAFNAWKAATNCTEGTVSATVYCVSKHSPAFHKFIIRWLGQVAGASEVDSTPGMMYVLQALYRLQIDPITPPCEEYYQFFMGAYLARGPTSPVVVKPWKKYLKNIGVKLRRRHKLLRLNIDPVSHSIESAVVENLKRTKTKKVKADVYVIALSVDDLI